MGNIVLGVFLILLGLGMLVGVHIPVWAMGLLAIVAGLLVTLGR